MSERRDVASEIAGASNILVLSPAFHPDRQQTCVDLLTTGAPQNTHVVGVTYAKSAEKWLAQYKEHHEDPERMSVISVGEQSRSTAAASGPSSPSLPGIPRVETVGSPSDLTELGIRLSTVIKEHEMDKWDDGVTDLALCYDSVTSLLQFVEPRRAFRFLHVMTNRLASAGVTAHYHLDPEAHDRQTVATIKSLFDTIVEVGEDGEWVVRRR